jgi:hypothetical protein
MSIILPCWNATLLTWEPDPLGIRHGTIWWATPRGELGFAVYFDTDPAGFHCGLRPEFRDETAGPRFYRGLLRDTFRLFPRARVPGDRQ